MSRPPTPTAPSSSESRKSAQRENIESIIWAVAMALVIRTFIIAPFKIPSGSMRMTLVEGDRILVSKLVYRFREPQRGEILVFKFPENPKRPFIKRLAAVGGDHVEIRDGQVLIDGKPEASDVMQHTYYYNQGQYAQPGQTTDVPTNSFFMLGDNSGSSHDSRFWGFVPRKLVIGKAVCIFWPPNRVRVLR